ncbi:MAG: DUF192 domain-containing protein [Alphaproteobacteria bacterium]|nr:DUF192 domain-containing protein [Alphaproteobacteria bacterium]
MCKFFKILTVMLMVLTSACSQEKTPTGQEVIVVSEDGNTVRCTFNVEIADTQEKIYHGLMGRTSIDENYGMLFDISIAPKDSDIAFWMKDTLIPLDMIFIDDNGAIYFIYQNAQPNDVTPIYTTKRPRAVLEVNAGQVEQFGIKIGDIVKTEILGNK